jgi:periplasmic divalent cation tolerance protein
MPDSSPSARIVLTTAASHEEAERLARTLVEERLAACATLIPAAQSIYRWEGKAQSASETLLLLKTDSGHLHQLEVRLHAIHSYTTPEFLVLQVDAGSRAYLEWLNASLGPANSDKF